MVIKYGCPYWGNENIPPLEFVQKIIHDGFDGIEFYLTPGTDFSRQCMQVIEWARSVKPDFFFSVLQLNITTNEKPEEHMDFLKSNIPLLASLRPTFINCHTGRDFFSFDDNCRIIEVTENLAVKYGVRILHETHRSRFSFHAPSLIPYLMRFPEMKLVGDFSHFTVVSESMMEHAKDILLNIYPHVSHIHARVGFEQGPQINDPSAPEWNSHINAFIGWWGEILEVKKLKGEEMFTITPEFGPAPYLPCEPFTQKPLSNAYRSNLFMLEILKERFADSY